MTKPRTNVEEGRAIAARPSLYVVIAIAWIFTTASAAQAALPAPLLTDTNPVSPGASLTPRIMGQITEGETKAVGLGLRSGIGGVITLAPEPNNIVRLYTESGCTGPVVGEGIADELEKVGILVNAPVAQDAVTTFYATQSNSETTSPCSPQGISYRQVSTPPGAPSFGSVSPPSPANDNFPHLIGAADPEATVSIYASGDCTGAVLASATGAVFAGGGIQVSVPDNSETTFSAKATIAGFTSACSAEPIVYREVTPVTDPGGGGASPPAPRPAAPRLRTIPGGWANDSTPIVTGSAPGAATVKVFADPNCKGSPVAKGSVEQFAAGFQVQVVENDVAVFAGVSVAGGEASACSDPVFYIEDSTAPRTRITMGPAAKTRKRTVTFRFIDSAGDAPGTTFRCKVDRKKWKKCASPLRLKRLKSKKHVLRVKAVDPAGNVEPRGAKRSFKVIPRR